MAKSFIETKTEIFDKFGLPIKEFCIIKIYHFYGKTLRGGIGHNHMYKQVIKKELNGKELWAALHLNAKNEDFYLLADKEKNMILSDTEIVQY